MNAIVEATTAQQRESGRERSADAAYRKELSFWVAGERYAVAVDLIKEIREYGAITRVPMAPPHIRGVLNLRGAVVPVIDLAGRLGLSRSETSRRTCIVILAVPDAEGSVDLGILVDGVDAVLDITPEEVEPAPPFGNTIASAFIDGIAKVGRHFVVILDPQTTFDVDELSNIAARPALAS